MRTKNQKEAFLKYEADNYFQRNKEVKYDGNSDIVIKVLQEYNATPKSVLEIGCNSGYRLNAISQHFKGVRTTGVEPSAEAIRHGESLYPDIKFFRATADDMSACGDASFDLVVIGFVLYVVDRSTLLKAIAETDRVLADGGVLMIIDFFSERALRNPYQHIKDSEAFAYKQNYDEIFVASKLYHLIDKRSMDHRNKSYDLSGDFYNKYVLTTLKKDLNAAYKH
jgi:ubiquinone/menaquinone biosynthesis C-methylase UbiE